MSSSLKIGHSYRLVGAYKLTNGRKFDNDVILLEDITVGGKHTVFGCRALRKMYNFDTENITPELKEAFTMVEICFKGQAQGKSYNFEFISK